MLTNTSEISSLIPLWSYKNNSIHRQFIFPNFSAVIIFIVHVSQECTELNHHPEWTNIYNKLDVTLTTHDMGGVTEKDIQLARKMDELYLNTGN